MISDDPRERDLLLKSTTIFFFSWNEWIEWIEENQQGNPKDLLHWKGCGNGWGREYGYETNYEFEVHCLDVKPTQQNRVVMHAPHDL
jgi:hypothetical protein